MTAMIGSLNPYKKEVIVVGAGISGLLAAYHLDQVGYQVTLIEASDRPGGIIQSHQSDWGTVDDSAHSLRATPAVIHLLQNLNVSTVTLNENAKQRWLFRNGKPKKIPLRIDEILSALIKAVFVKKTNHTGEKLENIADWAKIHTGTKVLDYVIAPLVQNIFAAQPIDLNLQAATPFLNLNAGHTLMSSGLLKKSAYLKPQMIGIQGGTEELVKALASHLRKKIKGKLKFNETITEIPKTKNIVFCTPAHVTASIIRSESPVLARALDRIRYSPIISVTAFTRIRDYAYVPEGMGVFFPKIENRPLLSLVLNSNAFHGRVRAPFSYLSVTGILGGHHNPLILEKSDEEIQEILFQELNQLYGFDGDLFDFRVNRWPNATPLYSNQILQVWKTAKETWCKAPGRVLFGNYTGELSIRGLIETAEQFRLLPFALVHTQAETHPKHSEIFSSPNF